MPDALNHILTAIRRYGDLFEDNKHQAGRLNYTVISTKGQLTSLL